MSLWRDPEGRVRVGWRVLLGVFVVVLAEFAGGIAAVMTAGNHPRLFDAVYQPATLVLVGIGFGVLLLAADQVQGNALPAMGLRRERAWRESSLGIALGGGMVVVAVFWIAVLGHLDFSARLNGRTARLAVLELFILTSGAMKEEMMFRGYPFQRLVEGVGAARAILVMSVLFGVVHLWNPHASVWGFVNTIAIGVVLSLAYLRTRALWFPWGVHFGWNATLGTAFGLPVSGITQFAVVVRGTAKGPIWLTGGAYGLEASALGTLVILLGLLALMIMTGGRRKPRASPAPRQEPASAGPENASPGIQL